MKNRGIKRVALLVTLAGLLTVSVGCIEAVVGAGAASFGLGYLFGTANAPTVTETHCYLNGAEVDCGTLP